MSKILLVEDDETLSKMYAKKLGFEGFEVITAFSGDEGIKKATDELPDLILQDIMLPGIDGFGVIRQLKKSEKTKDIPIIILTNLGTSEVFIDEAKILGVKQYLIKYKTSADEVAKVIKEELKKLT